MENSKNYNHKYITNKLVIQIFNISEFVRLTQAYS